MSKALGRIGSAAGQFLLVTWLVVTVIPLVVVLLSAVKSNTDIYRIPLWINPSDFRLENFLTSLAGPVGGAPLWVYLVNTVITTVCSIGLGMSAGILAAYGLARVRSRFTAITSRVFTVFITIPILATLVPLFTLTGALGIRNSPLGLALVYAAFMVPPTTVMMRPFFAAMPRELIESAKLDGAGEVSTFFHVVLPVVFPTIVGIIVINVIWAWSELAIALVLLTSPGNKTLPVGLLSFQGEFSTDLGVQAAGLILAALPMVIFYFVFSRRITEGMTAGALK